MSERPQEDEDEDEDDELPEVVVSHAGNAKSDAFFSDAACNKRIANFKASLERSKPEPRPLAIADDAGVDTDSADVPAEAQVPSI